MFINKTQCILSTIAHTLKEKCQNAMSFPWKAFRTFISLGPGTDIISNKVQHATGISSPLEEFEFLDPARSRNMRTYIKYCRPGMRVNIIYSATSCTENKPIPLATKFC